MHTIWYLKKPEISQTLFLRLWPILIATTQISHLLRDSFITPVAMGVKFFVHPPDETNKIKAKIFNTLTN